MKKIRVGVLGATGIVGQQYITLLENHPWFEVSYLAASKESSGMNYLEAVQGRWHMKKGVAKHLESLKVHDVEDLSAARKNCQMIFSALNGEKTAFFEKEHARIGLPVVSNTSFHRYSEDVPILIPELNHQHLEILSIQQKNHGWKKGFIVVKPNCAVQSYIAPLYVLHQKYTLAEVILSTMQATSGAGHPGLASIDIFDNIIPYIPEEEEKVEKETLKILSHIENHQFMNPSIKVSAHCNRVPITDGILTTVSVSFAKEPQKEEILDLWKNFQGPPQTLKLPSAPNLPITYLQEVDRPQMRLDREKDKAMTVSVGRLRKCSVLSWRFCSLSHNTIRGAAGGGILCAELLVSKKLIH